MIKGADVLNFADDDSDTFTLFKKTTNQRAAALDSSQSYDNSSIDDSNKSSPINKRKESVRAGNLRMDRDADVNRRDKSVGSDNDDEEEEKQGSKKQM